MDTIGTFKGKPISTMSKEELLDFAKWASYRTQELEKIESDTQEYRLKKEVNESLRH